VEHFMRLLDFADMALLAIGPSSDYAAGAVTSTAILQVGVEVLFTVTLGFSELIVPFGAGWSRVRAARVVSNVLTSVSARLET